MLRHLQSTASSCSRPAGIGLEVVAVLDAAWIGQVDRVRSLLADDPGAAHGLDEGRVSPLRTAAWHGHEAIVRLLLENGADATAANPDSGKTALDIAVERGHLRVVEVLRRAVSGVEPDPSR